MTCDDRRAGYQAKIKQVESDLARLDRSLAYAAPGLWLCAGIAVIGLADGNIPFAALGILFGIGAWAWKSGLNQERSRLASYRETLMAALESSS